MLPTA